MVFSTPLFLFVFLPLILAVYYAVPRSWRNAVLFVSSLCFYYWGEQIYTVIMLVSTIIDYTHGLLVRRCRKKGNDRGARMAVASSVIFNLAILMFFKYWDFLAVSLRSVGIQWMPVMNISLPIGISFYTFQTMSYTIDVYRGDADPQTNLIHFGTYVTLFPQLIAGPIIKYKDLDKQIGTRNYSAERFSSGVKRFVAGLSKKLLLANNLGLLWDTCKSIPISELTIADSWLGIAAFAFQIYFDFSGYSDMAIGLGRMLGFEFMENFNYPYISKSITDFWRRWHISLSTWFREYLYIPLGGNRCKRHRWVLNLLIVWAATGIWHGASWNYMIWGLYYFLILLAEKLLFGKWLSKAPAVLQHLYVIVLVLFGWAIFALEDPDQLISYLRVMIGMDGAGLIGASSLYYLRNYLPMFLIAGFASTPFAVRFLYGKCKEKTVRIAELILLILGLAVCTAYVVAGTYNPFLYFRF